jgi:hypothetical protein
MTINTDSTAEPPDTKAAPQVRVNGTLIHLNDQTPTGGQILAASELRPIAEYALMHWPSRGPTNEVGLDDVLDLPHDGTVLEFFAAKADGVSYFTLDEERYAWAGPLDEQILRKIGRVADNQELWFERTGRPDHQLKAGEVIKLERKGVERFYTRTPPWKLEVQGEMTEWERPQVLVRDALVKANIDPAKPWIVMLKVEGQAIRPVALTDTIDLSQPGIERLRVRPKHVDNGDGQREARRDFSLLPKDVLFLDGSGLHWHTVNDGKRWLIVDDYPLPAGYNASTCRIAVLMPPDYPSAQLDMFYCDPILLANGAHPPNTDTNETVNGVSFQRWSRHRSGGNAWSPTCDNVSTHFALIEHAIGREVGA